MKRSFDSTRRWFIVAAAAVGVTQAAKAQSAFPIRPITMIVGYTPGGNNDIIARIVATELSAVLGHPVIVENRSGAVGRIAGDYVARAAPDGYTLLVGATGPMVYAPALYPDTKYDPIKDFAPITLLGSTPLVLAVGKALPYKTIADLLARAKTEEVTYAQGASPFYVAAESLKKLAGLKLLSVPYRGNVQAVQAAVAGEVQLVVADVPTVIAQVQAGNLRALAVTGATRSRYLPDAPTLQEAGIPFTGLSWTGLFAPAATPKATLSKLHESLKTVLGGRAMQDRLAQLHFETAGIGMAPPEFGNLLAKDLAHWRAEIRKLGIVGE